MNAEFREDDPCADVIARDASKGQSEWWSKPAAEHPSSRVPHIGHVLLLLTLALLLFFLAQVVFFAFAHPAVAAARVIQPKRQLGAQAAMYIATLGLSAVIFPVFWGRGFLVGINWNGRLALRQSFRLVPLGLAVGLAVQAISSLIPMPKSLPMDDFFRTPSDVWIVALFGTLLAPLIEEIAFRGFLLPAFAIAFDWLHATLRYLGTFAAARLAGADAPRHVEPFHEDAHAGLNSETGNLFFRSRTAVIVASVVSSILFALLHAEQIAHAWGGLAVLFCVSLVLTTIRVRSKSVACSTIVHASYNLSVFITIFLATGGFRHLDRMAK
jgi:membrane protease YdiL (CAAX protease family)